MVMVKWNLSSVGGVPQPDWRGVQVGRRRPALDPELVADEAPATGRWGTPSTMYDHRRTPKYRACHPRVESPGGRRLASGTTPGRPGPSIKPEALSGAITRTESRASGHVAEAAPGEARQCDRLGPAREDGGAEPHRPGLAQLARYLARTWSRAGITPQRHDDCSQEVYLSLLEGWGPDRFRRVVGAIDRRGIRGVLGRETAEGPDFYRVIDRVKMRTRRERSCPS